MEDNGKEDPRPVGLDLTELKELEDKLQGWDEITIEPWATWEPVDLFEEDEYERPHE